MNILSTAMMLSNVISKAATPNKRGVEALMAQPFKPTTPVERDKASFSQTAQNLSSTRRSSLANVSGVSFPPTNAPQSFKDAWAKATQGMDEMSIPAEMPLAAGLANIRQDPATGKVSQLSPDDPAWRDPYASPDFNYKGAVKNMLSNLDYQHKANMISPERYQLEKGFYSRLANAMA